MHTKRSVASSREVRHHTGGMTGVSGQRRQSYGPTSPRVGARGARTLDAILTASLEAFAAKGFDETTMQDIADLVGISRAAVYQYFENKEQIFVELLEGCGSAVVEITERMGAFGPDAEGFGQLRRWLGEWRSVYDRYATLFMEWTGVEGEDAPVGELVHRFNATLTDLVADKLRLSGVSGVPLDLTASVLTGVILRFNHLRVVGGSVDDVRRGYFFAVALQLMLFPQTSAKELRGGRSVVRSWFQSRIGGRLSVADAEAPAGGFDPIGQAVTARAARTINSLLEAGARTLAERGYARTSVDEIVGRAAVARGNFYKYFGSKLDLLYALADRARRDSLALTARLERVDPAVSGPGGFTEWVAGALELGEEHRGVYRVWMERSPASDDLSAMRRQVAEALRRAVFVMLAAHGGPHPADLRTSEVLIVAMLDQVPDAFELSGLESTREQQVELIAALLSRGLFGRACAAAVGDGRERGVLADERDEVLP